MLSFPLLLSVQEQRSSENYNFAINRNVIESYGDQVIYIQQPDQTDPVLPAKEKKFKGEDCFTELIRLFHADTHVVHGILY